MTSLGADTGLTVLDSRAEMRADERSWAVTGVVTWELMLLSRHHFTGKVKFVNGQGIGQKTSYGSDVALPVQEVQWEYIASAHIHGCIPSVVL